jgi:hypothetical protein
MIQSIGLNRCHEELNRDPNAKCSDQQQNLEKLSSLIFVLSQLIAVSVSMSENDVYSRIFVTT